MANESEDVEVNVDANADKLLASFDKMGDKASAWAKKLDSAVDWVKNSIGDKSAGISDKLKGILDNAGEGKAGEALGEKLGSKLLTGLIGKIGGGTLGTLIGGPLGTLVGGILGDKLAGALGDGLDGGLGDIQESLGGVNDLVKEGSRNWDMMKEAGTESFDKIREAIKGIDWSNLETGQQGFITLIATAAGEINNLTDESLARIESMIDQGFALFQKPLAFIADSTQTVLQKLGLVEEETEKWGDKIRSIQSIGEKAIYALGYSLGYVSGLFEKVGATIVDNVHLPLLRLVNSTLPLLAEQLKELGKVFGKNWGDGVLKFSERSKKELEDFQVFVTRVRGQDLGARADEWGQAAVNRLQRGRELMKERDARERGGAEEDPIEEAVKKLNNAAGLAAKAVFQGSSESVAMLAQAQARAMGMHVDDPAKEAVKVAKESRDLQKEANGLLGKIAAKEQIKVEKK